MEVTQDMSQNGQSANVDYEKLVSDLKDIVDLIEKLDVDVNRLKTNGQMVIRKSDNILKDTENFSDDIDKSLGTFTKIIMLKELVTKLRMTIMEASGTVKMMEGETSRVGFMLEDLKKKLSKL